MKLSSKIFKKKISLITLACTSFIFIVQHEIFQRKQTYVQFVTASDATFYHEYIAVHVFGMEPYIPREKKKVIKYTMGMAITYTPGIVAGYVITEMKGKDHEFGKSPIYQRCLYYLGFIYALIGLFFVRCVLKKWFDDMLIALVLAIIFWGTNLYYYVNVEPLMAHAASFCFISGFLFFALRLIEKQTIRNSIGTGIFLGMTILIRPTNIIILLVPFVFLLSKKGAFKQQLISFSKKPFGTILMVVIPLLFFIPQMLYWHHYTGSWLYDSYGKESFYFSNPAILQILFSFRKGWFIYTPIMLLIIPGAVVCFRQNRSLFWGILAFMIVNVYVMSSWWCWWYGGGFGLRPMIDFYGVLSIWIAYFFQYLSKKKMVFISSIAVVGVIIYLNLYHTKLARLHIVHFDSMTFKAFKEIYFTQSNRGKFNDEQWDQLLDHPNYAGAFEGKRFW